MKVIENGSVLRGQCERTLPLLMLWIVRRALLAHTIRRWASPFSGRESADPELSGACRPQCPHRDLTDVYTEWPGRIGAGVVLQEEDHVRDYVMGDPC